MLQKSCWVTVVATKLTELFPYCILPNLSAKMLTRNLHWNVMKCRRYYLYARIVSQTTSLIWESSLKCECALYLTHRSLISVCTIEVKWDVQKPQDCRVNNAIFLSTCSWSIELLVGQPWMPVSPASRRSSPTLYQDYNSACDSVAGRAGTWGKSMLNVA